MKHVYLFTISFLLSFTASQGQTIHADFDYMVKGHTVFLKNLTADAPSGSQYAWACGDSWATVFSTDSQPLSPFRLTAEDRYLYRRDSYKDTIRICLTIYDTSMGGQKCKDIRIFDDSGCVLKTDVFSIAPDTAGLVLFRNRSVCPPAATYYIDFGDNGFAADVPYDQNVKYNYRSANARISYNVNVLLSDSTSGCWDDTVFVVTRDTARCSPYFSVSKDTGNYNVLLNYNASMMPYVSYHWDFGDGDTSSLPVPRHTYSSFGTYNVCLTIKTPYCSKVYCDSVGMDASGKLTKRAGGFTLKVNASGGPISGIRDLSAEQPQPYPNPFNEVLYLPYMQGMQSLKLFAANGMLARSFSFTGDGQDIQLDTQELPQGIYILRIESRDCILNQRLIKSGGK